MRNAFLLTLLLTPFFILAQPAFETFSLDEAFAKAKAESKFVLVQFEAAQCDQCNDVANKGFSNKEVAGKADQLFVCLRVGATHAERSRIATRYDMPAQSAFGTLFLDNNGALLHSFRKTTTFSKDLLAQMDKAIERAGEVLNISVLEKAYRDGNKSFGLLESLLQKRKTLNLPTDALLDDYVSALPPDSLKSVSTLSFVAQMAPMLDSKADSVLRSDRALFNRMWYGLNLLTRIQINNTIVNKGMKKAIAEKSQFLAIRTAGFARSTNTNHIAGAKTYQSNMLRYYDETGDTANYFPNAVSYYNQYYLTVKPDSIRRLDSIRRMALLKTLKKDTVREGNKVTITASFAFSSFVQKYAHDLNEGAYKFYLRTTNTSLLSSATEWAKRALEFSETPEVLDTYAKLLYKQNQRSDAVVFMAKAVALQQKRGFPTKKFEDVLTRMKSGQAVSE